MPKPWRAVFDKLFLNGVRRCLTRDDVRPDGEVNKHDGFVLAWDEGRRSPFTDAIKPDLMPDGPFMLGIWTIEPEGDGNPLHRGRASTGPRRL